MFLISKVQRYLARAFDRGTSLIRNTLYRGQTCRQRRWTAIRHCTTSPSSLSHTHTLTVTHTHSLSHTHTHTRSLTHAHSHTLLNTRSHAHHSQGADVAAETLDGDTPLHDVAFHAGHEGVARLLVSSAHIYIYTYIDIHVYINI